MGNTVYAFGSPTLSAGKPQRLPPPGKKNSFSEVSNVEQVPVSKALYFLFNKVTSTGHENMKPHCCWFDHFSLNVTLYDLSDECNHLFLFIYLFSFVCLLSSHI